MSRDERPTAYFTTLFEKFPLDLGLTVALALLTGVAVFAPGVSGTPLRLVLGIPFLVFLPGYALVSALFPRSQYALSESSLDETDSVRGGGSIDGFERFSLSVGTSVAVNSMIGFGLDFTPWGIRMTPILVSICAFTVVAAVVAAVRRLRTPPAERFSVPLGHWAARGRRDLFGPGSRAETLVNVALAVSLLLSVASVAYAIGLPHQQDSFTQFYILGQNESDSPGAEEYPDTITVGGHESLYVGIENQERQRVNYTVVVLLQSSPNNSSDVHTVERLDRFRASLGPNQTKLVEHSVSPTTRGDRLRLTYLLYRGSPPADPSLSSAYRSAYIWVNVTGEERPTAKRLDGPVRPHDGRMVTIPRG